MTNLTNIARSWVGTRFAHQGRRKATAHDAGGVDCLGLLVGVAEECGLQFDGARATQLDETDYGHYPNEKRLYTALSKHLTPTPQGALQAGDIALMRIDGRNQHLGILAEKGDILTLIHAYAPARKVVEHRLDAAWKARIVGVFRLS